MGVVDLPFYCLENQSDILLFTRKKLRKKEGKSSKPALDIMKIKFRMITL